MALVLSRKPGESLVIDGQAVITIVRATPGKVSIAITAPATTQVVREELLTEEESSDL